MWCDYCRQRRKKKNRVSYSILPDTALACCIRRSDRFYRFFFFFRVRFEEKKNTVLYTGRPCFRIVCICTRYRFVRTIFQDRDTRLQSFIIKLLIIIISILISTAPVEVAIIFILVSSKNNSYETRTSNTG